MLLSACLPLFGQGDNTFMVSGKGQLISFPCIDSYEYKPYNILPKAKPKTQSITIKKHDLSNKSGEWERTNYVIYTIYYDSLCLVNRIEKKQQYGNTEKMTINYDNLKRIVGCEELYLGKWKYSYDDKGYLKQLVRNNITFLYSIDNKGNITKIDEYFGTTKENTHTYQYDASGRKSYYCNKTKSGNVISEISWNYDSNGKLISVWKKDNMQDLWGNNKTMINEYRFEYSADGNPLRCIQYEIGDIEIVKGGWEYEYSYTYYPTEEELRKQAEEQRIADSIRQAEIKRQEEEQLRIENLKTAYSSCKYLFKKEQAYDLCLKKEQSAMEQEIMRLIDERMRNIMGQVKTGYELRGPNNQLKTNILNICNICQNLDNQVITTHTEEKLSTFISSYKPLAKAYKKAAGKKPSEFLTEYINK